MTAIQHVTWGEVEILVERIVKQAQRDKFKPRHIIALGRGGLIPARLLSDWFGSCPIEYLKARRYEGMEGKPLAIDPVPVLNCMDRTVPTLIVDDVCDKGVTMAEAVSGLTSSVNVGLTNWATATLHFKSHSRFMPAYFGRRVENTIWLAYPWEMRESLVQR